MRCLLIGGGDMAHGLARQYHLHFDEKSNHILQVGRAGKGSKNQSNTFLDTNVPFVNTKSALKKADIVILAIPSSSYKNFISEHFYDLVRCVVVDITNPSVKGQDVEGALHELRKEKFFSLRNIMMPDIDLRWVKAFNDNGAIDLISRKEISKVKFSTTMCSNNQDALEKVKEFTEAALGFDVVTLPDEKYASEMENYQGSVGKYWEEAVIVVMIIFVITEIYSIVRYNVSGRASWSQLPLYVTNKAICWTAITGFSLAQLPGVLAKMMRTWNKRIRNERYYELPKWLINLLEIRKHVALLSFFFVAMHAIMSLLIFKPGYYHYLFDEDKLTGRAEWSMFFGVFSFALYCLLSVASLPSVSRAMTYAQWKFSFGFVVWVALITGLVHVIAMSVNYWSRPERWGGKPPVSLLSALVPFIVIILKIFQELFCRVVTFCTTKARSIECTHPKKTVTPNHHLSDLKVVELKQEANNTDWAKF